jgi:hypothetical protein
MPTRNVNLTDHDDEDKARLSLLRSLAADGFSELDQGRGVPFDDEKELANYVRQIGRRAAAEGGTP